MRSHEPSVPTQDRANPARRAHGHRDADLQRGRGAGIRRPARHLRIARGHRRAATGSISSSCPTATMPTRASRSWRRGQSCAATVNGFGRIFYRWRQHRIKRKSGNIADFCRRWGRNYRYMVVLDADSVMTRRVPDRAGAADGGQSGRRNHPDRAARGRSRYAVRAHATVRHPRLRPGIHRRPALLAAGRIALLGTQRHHPRRAVHRALRARPPARARCAVGRDPVPRLRRGGADAARRLGRCG